MESLALTRETNRADCAAEEHTIETPRNASAPVLYHTALAPNLDSSSLQVLLTFLFFT